jgi:hypothetical protein
MSLDRNNVKQEIDKAAAHLKTATDKLAEKSHEAGESLTETAKELARKTGDQMIKRGEQLKKAAL